MATTFNRTWRDQQVCHSCGLLGVRPVVVCAAVVLCWLWPVVCLADVIVLCIVVLCPCVVVPSAGSINPDTIALHRYLPFHSFFRPTKNLTAYNIASHSIWTVRKTLITMYYITRLVTRHNAVKQINNKSIRPTYDLWRPCRVIIAYSAGSINQSSYLHASFCNVNA